MNRTKRKSKRITDKKLITAVQRNKWSVDYTVYFNNQKCWMVSDQGTILVYGKTLRKAVEAAIKEASKK